VPGELDGLEGGLGAGLGHDGHPSRRLVDHRLHDVATLGPAERGELAGRAARDDAVDPAVDVAVHDSPQGLLVDGAVVVEGGEEGGQDAAQLTWHGRFLL
jgi:hypothetical protein